MTSEHPASALARSIAHDLAEPDAIPTPLTRAPWWRQSMAHGAPGIALLHIERAASGLAPWQRAHTWLTYVTWAPLTNGPSSHLFYGAPAIAHVLDCATRALPGSYEHALDRLDEAIAADVRARLDAANLRIDSGRLPSLAEFDVIRGLTGLGSYLLRREPNGKALRAILEYLVRLSEPLQVAGEAVPGWWTPTAPDGRSNDRFSRGHANFGLAHGIGGPLALLALTARRGITVDDHFRAIDRICGWFDRWRIDLPSGPVWPYWVNHPQLRDGHRSVSGAQRPSWCYGTAGLARAQQLAALARDDAHRRNLAERALLETITSRLRSAAIDDLSLCHGFAGLVHIAARAAADAAPDNAERLRALISETLDVITRDHRTGELPEQGERRPAFLEGATGIALGTSGALSVPRTNWDTCLLIA